MESVLIVKLVIIALMMLITLAHNAHDAHNVIIFGADSNKSIQNSNRLAGNILVSRKGLIQKINKQTVYADHELLNINYTQIDKNNNIRNVFRKYIHRF